MSIAQRLYASSQNSTAAPMINANDISCLSTSLDVSGRGSPQSRNRTLPSPPLSTFSGNQDSRVTNHFPPHHQAIDDGRLTIGTPSSSVFSAALQLLQHHMEIGFINIGHPRRQSCFQATLSTESSMLSPRQCPRSVIREIQQCLCLDEPLI